LERVGFPGPVLQQLRTRRLRPLAQNERGFAIRDGAQLLTGFIDRLVLLEDGGQVVAAEIIDFKTDLLDGGDAQQRADKVAFYAPQLRAYQRAVSQLTHCPPERIVATLLFVEAGIVATVT
jgi:ATP-dependent exoDNAse (exonuclease V) beta subunit